MDQVAEGYSTNWIVDVVVYKLHEVAALPCTRNDYISRC